MFADCCFKPVQPVYFGIHQFAETQICDLRRKEVRLPIVPEEPKTPVWFTFSDSFERIVYE